MSQSLGRCREPSRGEVRRGPGRLLPRLARSGRGSCTARKRVEEERMLAQRGLPGIHRSEDGHTNWYRVEDGGRLTIVDCGVPTSWASFEQTLRTLGHG